MNTSSHLPPRFEPRLLRGASKLWAHYLPPTIQFEIQFYSFTKTQCKCEQWLSAFIDLGYEMTSSLEAPYTRLKTKSDVNFVCSDLGGKVVGAHVHGDLKR